MTGHIIEALGRIWRALAESYEQGKYIQYRDEEGRQIVREYHEDTFHLDHQMYHLIRIRDPEFRGIVLDEEGRIPIFSDLDSLKVYASLHGLRVEFYKWRLVGPHNDLDLLAAWLARPYQETAPDAEYQNCAQVWDLVSLALHNCDMLDAGTANADLYNKLVVWMRRGGSVAEAERLKALLGAGLAHFRSLIKEYGAA